MEAQLAHAEILIEFHHIIHEFLHILCLAKPPAQRTDAVADALVEQLAVLIHIGVIANQGTAGSAESLIKSCQVKVEQFLEYGKVVFCKIVDAAFYRAYDLAGCAEGVFMVDQQKGQIIVPEVAGKAKGACHLHKLAGTPVEEFS